MTGGHLESQRRPLRGHAPTLWSGRKRQKKRGPSWPHRIDTGDANRDGTSTDEEESISNFWAATLFSVIRKQQGPNPPAGFQSVLQSWSLHKGSNAVKIWESTPMIDSANQPKTTKP